MSTQVLISTPSSFLLLAGTGHQTKEPPWNGRHPLLSTWELLPCSLCVQTEHVGFGRWVALLLSCGWWHRKSQKIRIPHWGPAAPKWVTSVLSSSLLPVPMATHLSCRLLHASSNFTQHFWSSRGVQNRSSTSPPCAHLGLPPLLLLLFPTAGAPSRWAVVLNRGEHHHSNKTPKQPQELSPLQDTFPLTANTGHQSPSSEPGFAFLT